MRRFVSITIVVLCVFALTVFSLLTFFPNWIVVNVIQPLQPQPTEAPQQQAPVESRPLTIGLGSLTRTEAAWDGYTLLALLRSERTLLIDMDGKIVHQWRDEAGAIMAYLLEDGSLLRTGMDAKIGPEKDHPRGNTNALVRYDWDGNIVWQYRLKPPFLPHHDIEPMPNGNILLMAWDLKSREEALQAGMDERALAHDWFYSESIFEIQPTGADGGEIVWEWHLWDHLVQSHDSTRDNFGDPEKFPRRVDLNYIESNRELAHFNSIDYHPELDQILLSASMYGELWVIDHGTTSEEAASGQGGRYGNGGDLLYRCGNPSCYLGESFASQRLLYHQHDPHWIAEDVPGAGHVLVYNNGTVELPEHMDSRVHELALPVLDDGSYELSANTLQFSPPEVVWTFQPKLFSHQISGAQRLANGNTLVCSGNPGYLVEVKTDGEIAWEFVNPHESESAEKLKLQRGRHSIFRAMRYGKNFPAFQGRDLKPLEESE